MTLEILLLALANTVRPTSLAAVYALVASESPRRLMVAYVASGLAFTVAFGLVVIWTLNGVVVSSGSDETRAVAEIAAGVLAIAFGVAVSLRLVGRSRPDDAPGPPRRWDRLRARSLGLRTAALAGPATHIPGLFYLLALNVIVTAHPRVTSGFIELVVYNAVWFALPVAALIVCIARPPLAREAVGVVERWTRVNTRSIIVGGSLAVGVFLVVRGALIL